MYNPNMYDERVTYPRVGEIFLYTVNKGDNIYRIAKTFNSEVHWIKAMNQLDDEKLIFPNQQLLIPVIYQNVTPLPQPHQRQTYDLYF